MIEVSKVALPAVIAAVGGPELMPVAIAGHPPAQHKNVLQATRKAMEKLGEIGRLNFQPSSYVNKQSKSQPLIRFSHNVLLNVTSEVGGLARSRSVREAIEAIARSCCAMDHCRCCRRISRVATVPYTRSRHTGQRGQALCVLAGGVN
jgi:hypothetical protein